MDTIRNKNPARRIIFLFLASAIAVGAAFQHLHFPKKAAVRTAKPATFSETEEIEWLDAAPEESAAEAELPIEITATVDTTTAANTLPCEQVSVFVAGLSKRKVRLEMEPLLQNPELPTGCEITSLAAVFRYYGCAVDKMDLLQYLPCSEVKTSQHEAFFGDPRDSVTGCGCFSEPIVTAAKRYLQARPDLPFQVNNLSGAAFEELLALIENGYPVILWGTENMEIVRWNPNQDWTYNGTPYHLLCPEHCLVLIGYDFDNATATVCDPLCGIADYPLCTVKARYITMESQAVLLKPLPTE